VSRGRVDCWRRGGAGGKREEKGGSLALSSKGFKVRRDWEGISKGGGVVADFEGKLRSGKRRFPLLLKEQAPEKRESDWRSLWLATGKQRSMKRKGVNDSSGGGVRRTRNQREKGVLFFNRSGLWQIESWVIGGGLKGA